MKLIQYSTETSQYNGPFGPKAGWAAAGMGYIVKTDNGKLVVIDGGWEEDAEGFVRALEINADGKKPIVDAWIITHPHEDHYYALRKIAKDPALCARLEIKQIIYDYRVDSLSNEPTDYVKEGERDMEYILSQTSAKAYLPSVGEELRIDTLKITFLFTPNGEKNLPNANFMSLIFIIEDEKSGKRCMFTGDAAPRTMQAALDGYKGSLACNALQLPHHGLCDTGHLEFYKAVNADMVLIPTCIAGDACMRTDLYGGAPQVNLWAENNAKKVYKAFEGTQTIEL